MEKLFLILGYLASNNMLVSSMDLETKVPEPRYVRLNKDGADYLLKLKPDMSHCGKFILVKLKW